MPRPADKITLESSPGSDDGSRAWRDLGREALNQGEAEEALWCLRRAIELCSDDPHTWQLLGNCFERIGEEERARRCYTVASRELMRCGRRPLEVSALVGRLE